MWSYGALQLCYLSVDDLLFNYWNRWNRLGDLTKKCNMKETFVFWSNALLCLELHSPWNRTHCRSHRCHSWFSPSATSQDLKWNVKGSFLLHFYFSITQKNLSKYLVSRNSAGIEVMTHLPKRGGDLNRFFLSEKNLSSWFFSAKFRWCPVVHSWILLMSISYQNWVFGKHPPSSPRKYYSLTPLLSDIGLLIKRPNLGRHRKLFHPYIIYIVFHFPLSYWKSLHFL